MKGSEERSLEAAFPEGLKPEDFFLGESYEGVVCTLSTIVRTFIGKAAFRD